MGALRRARDDISTCRPIAACLGHLSLKKCVQPKPDRAEIFCTCPHKSTECASQSTLGLNRNGKQRPRLRTFGRLVSTHLAHRKGVTGLPALSGRHFIKYSEAGRPSHRDRWTPPEDGRCAGLDLSAAQHAKRAAEGCRLGNLTANHTTTPRRRYTGQPYRKSDHGRPDTSVGQIARAGT